MIINAFGDEDVRFRRVKKNSKGHKRGNELQTSNCAKKEGSGHPGSEKKETADVDEIKLK